MMLSPAVLVENALYVNIWRRLERVVFEYPNDILARWTIPYSSDINAIAQACGADGMVLAAGRGCLERWKR